MPLTALTAWAADPVPTIVVSATSAQIGVAPDSLASIYGDRLAAMTAAAGSPPWPTNLGDMPGVFVVDSQAQRHDASLIFVSPSQMNLWIPVGTALGPAMIEFPFSGLGPGEGTAALRVVPVNIQKIAPGIFTADGSGSGVAAATAVRVQIPSGIQTPVPVFGCNQQNACAATPIDTGIDTPVYLSLYGTGIRGASSLAHITVTVGAQTVPAIYAGPQPTIPGLDQVNVPLPLNLRGAGLVSVTVTVDGLTSNTAQIDIQ
jgi:uncharacterized protein (TIGR03437 family)